VLFLLLSIFVIGSFGWRVYDPGFEFPSRAEQLTTIAVDLLCIVGLVGLKARIVRGAPSGQSDWTKWQVLFFIALVAGLGLLAIRLNGNASWWTGHLFQVNPGNDGFLHL
jgi:hypothetical protein